MIHAQNGGFSLPEGVATTTVGGGVRGSDELYRTAVDTPELMGGRPWAASAELIVEELRIFASTTCVAGTLPEGNTVTVAWTTAIVADGVADTPLGTTGAPAAATAAAAAWSVFGAVIVAAAADAIAGWAPCPSVAETLTVVFVTAPPARSRRMRLDAGGARTARLLAGRSREEATLAVRAVCCAGDNPATPVVKVILVPTTY